MAKGFSKEIIKREKSVQLLSETVKANDASMAAAIDKLFEPLLEEGEKLPDTRLFIRLIDRAIAQKATAMVEADRAHQIELADDAAPRQARDEYGNKLRKSLVAFRSGVDTVHGAAGLKALGVHAAVPAENGALVSLGKKVAALLHEPKLGAPINKEVTINLEAFAKTIRIRSRKLAAALQDVAREVREAQVTLDAKDKAQESHDSFFQRGATAIEALARLASMDAVADKARPSARTPGQTEQEEELEPDDEDEEEEEDGEPTA